MTECNATTLEFSSLKRQKVVADFAGGQITSDAGALLLREADRRVGLVDAINAVIHDPRNPVYTIHQQRDMLAQRIFGIALGYEDLNDHAELRVDPLMQVATERGVDSEMPMASTSTLHRLENRISREELIALSKVFVESQDEMLHAIITNTSLKEMDIREGNEITAIVKSTELILYKET